LGALIEETSFDWQGKVFSITCSIGIATAPDDSIADWNDLLEKADQALYKGKGAGRNVVLSYNPDGGQTSTGEHQRRPRPVL